MTITALAKHLNVSTMTVYRRCKKNGVDIESLRDSQSGELSHEGIAVISAWFDSVEPQSATDNATPVEQSANSDKTVNEAVLRAQLDAANDTISRLEAERDRLVSQLEVLHAALEREQTDRQQERRLLLPSGADTEHQQPRKGLFARLFGR